MVAFFSKKEPENSEMLNDLPLQHDPAKDFFYFIWDLVKTGVIVFIIAFLIRYFLIQPFIVDGGSMMPNYVNQEYLLAEKLSYALSTPKRGDVIVFKYPNNPTINYIKRVIGLPGETVEIADNQVKIVNNDHPGGIILDESYIPKGAKTLTGNDKKFTTAIPSDGYFVMGDNREHSSDSREWGILPEANIVGRSWLTVKPLDRFGFQRHVSYPGLSFRSFRIYVLRYCSSVSENY